MTVDPADVVSYDLETHRFQDGLSAMPIVCGSTASISDGACIEDVWGAMHTAWQILDDTSAIIAGANIAFDFGCLCAADDMFLRPVFDAYRAGRVWDILVAQALDAIAGGHLFIDPRTGGQLRNNGKVVNRYGLNTCTSLVLGREDAKDNDFWRERYAILERVPMHLWPEEALQYPKDDATNTLEVALVQMGLAQGNFLGRNMSNMADQCETAWCLHLGAMWGFRTDGDKIAVIKARALEEQAVMRARYSALGWVRPDGTEDGRAVRRAVALAYGADASLVCCTCGGHGRPWVQCRGEKLKGRYRGCQGAGERPSLKCKVCNGVERIPDKKGTCVGCDGTGLDLRGAPGLPMTPSGSISTSRDTMSESGDEDCEDYGDNKPDKVLGTYIPYLEKGVDKPVTLNPNVLVASTRTSYADPSQTLPKQGGLRETIVPREGCYLCSVDYAAVELCSLAQVCLWVVGYSRMAEVINATKDPGLLHTKLAARMIGVPFEEMVARVKAGDKEAKNFRSAAKPWNFGAPGGMGAAKLVLTNRKENAGKTTGPDGRVYAGIRFCILVGGAKVCGAQKVIEWKRRQIPPTCLECLQLAEHQLRPAFFAEWPEVKEYHEWITAALDANQGEIPFFGPGIDMVRGGLDFCNAANNGFQSLAAFGAKLALRRVTRESYLDEESPLYKARTRPIMFVHDEILSEMLCSHAHLAGPRKARVMIDAMREYIPDVHIAAEPALSTYLTKDAEPAYKDGILVPWYPKEK